MADPPTEDNIMLSLSQEEQDQFQGALKRQIMELMKVQEVDQVLLEYIMVMVNNGKKMEEIESALTDLLGNEIAKEMVNWLMDYIADLLEVHHAVNNDAKDLSQEEGNDIVSEYAKNGMTADKVQEEEQNGGKGGEEGEEEVEYMEEAEEENYDEEGEVGEVERRASLRILQAAVHDSVESTKNARSVVKTLRTHQGPPPGYQPPSSGGGRGGRYQQQQHHHAKGGGGMGKKRSFHQQNRQGPVVQFGGGFRVIDPVKPVLFHVTGLGKEEDLRQSLADNGIRHWGNHHHSRPQQGGGGWQNQHHQQRHHQPPPPYNGDMGGGMGGSFHHHPPPPPHHHFPPPHHHHHHPAAPPPFHPPPPPYVPHSQHAAAAAARGGRGGYGPAFRGRDSFHRPTYHPYYPPSLSLSQSHHAAELPQQQQQQAGRPPVSSLKWVNPNLQQKHVVQVQNGGTAAAAGGRGGGGGGRGGGVGMQKRGYNPLTGHLTHNKVWVRPQQVVQAQQQAASSASAIDGGGSEEGGGEGGVDSMVEANSVVVVTTEITRE